MDPLTATHKNWSALNWEKKKNNKNTSGCIHGWGQDRAGTAEGQKEQQDPGWIGREQRNEM